MEDNMAEPETIYGKYFINIPFEPCKFGPMEGGTFATRMRFFCAEFAQFFGNKNISLQWNYITQPATMETVPHSHDFDQFLFFYGGDASDISKFDAEVEICLGPEGEKHIVNAPKILHIPAGMIHCPLIYKVINKPIIFMNIALTPLYRKTEHAKN
jgi:hypothetical protein